MALVSWAGLLLANRVGRAHGNWLLRSASRGLLRNPLGTLTQMTALCLALFSLLTMALIQRDALNAWQASIPPDAPNRFVFNIQPDQKDAVLQALTAQGIKADIVFPMVRARLIERNGSPIGPEQFKDDRAKRLVDREFNASFTNQLPANNVVTAGQWWGAKANIVQTEPACNNMSFEAGIVKTLGLSLGDKLVFDVGGQKVETVLSSIRTLKWESMRVNFFAIGQPCAFEALPHTYITTVRVDGQSIAGLLKDFPNLSILDTDMISKQAQTVLTQLTGAINVLFALALVAGVLVVFVTSNASRAARLQEAAVLRALGASSRQVWLSQWLEQGIIGALAGGFAGLVAWLVGQAVVTYGLEFQAMLGLWPLWTGILAGIGAVLLGSLWVLQAIRAQSPALQLRGEV